MSAQFVSAQCYSVTFMVDLGSNIPDPNGRIYVMGNFKTPSWVAGAVRLNKIDGTANRYAITVFNICKDTFDFIFLNGDSSLTSSREVFPNPASQTCLVYNGPSNYDRRFIKTSVGDITLAYNFKSCPTILPLGLNTARKVLYEVFSSSTLPSNLAKNLKGIADSINRRNSNAYTIVYYPVNWPSSGDPYYTAEVNAKTNYYQQSWIPATIIDGKFKLNTISIKFSDTAKIMHDIPSFVKMTTNHSTIGNQINIIDSIKPNISMLGYNYKLRTAIVELITKNNIKISGETEFLYVMKKMLPDQNIILNNTNTNQAFSRSYTFPGNYRLPLGSSNAINLNTEHSVENFNNLIAVSWIQNDSSKEVIQSSWSNSAKVIVSDSVICSYEDSIVVYAFGGNIMLGQQNLGSNLVRLKPSFTTQYVFRSFDGLKITPFTIYVDDSITITPNVTNVNFNTCGSNSPFIIGGTTTYVQSKSFSWYLNDTLLPGKTLSIDTFRLAGSYKLRVTSHRGCFAEQVFNISSLNSVFSPNFSSNRQNATSAPFDFTFANQTPSLSAYSYAWHWGDGTKDTSSNPIVFKTYFANGNYTVKLVAADKNTGCKDSITKTNYIICSGLLPLNFTSFKTQPTCFGFNNGGIAILPTGGVSPYQYKIDTGAYQSINTFSNLKAGVYLISIKDAYNTLYSRLDTLTNPPAISAGAINGTTNTFVNTSNSYAVSNQAGASYTWTVVNGTISSGVGTNIIQVLWGSAAGQGKIILQFSKNACTVTDTLLVNIGSSPLSISTTKTQPTCFGSSNASITVNALGGAGSYLYRINNGVYQSSNVFNNLNAGIYTVQVKDANSTEVGKIDTIINPVPIVIGGINGETLVGVGSLKPYQIAAQNGATYAWNIINGTLMAGNGTNSIQVQWAALSGTGKIIVNINVNGCTDADTLDIIISNSVPLSVSTIKENITCASLGKITINASGGSFPYQYALNSGSFQSINVFSGLAAGVYLTITKDNAGALVQKYDTLLNLSQPVVAGSINGPISVPTLALSNYIVGQQAGINYFWTITGGVLASGQGTNIIQVSWGASATQGKVNVRVSNASGCSDSSNLSVSVGANALSNVTMNQFNLYPNPATEEVTILSNSNLNGAYVQLVDLLGRTIMHVKIDTNDTKYQLPIASIKPGTYMVLINKNEDKARIKLIIE